MASNIYMIDIATSTDESSIDLSSIKDITLQNLDGTNTITVAFGQSTATATEKITLGTTSSAYYSVSLSGKGGTLYYDANGNTPTLRIIGTRF